MAAASRDLRSYVKDVVTCPICQELCDSPKSLPCLHTFCLKCIERHCRDKEPGDEVSCPVCRLKFKIPDNGVHGLVSNFFIAGLVEVRKTASGEQPHRVMKVGTQSVVLRDLKTLKLIQEQRRKCDQHKNTEVKFYCFECKMNICAICICEEHKQHKSQNIDTVAVECCKQIDTDMELVKTRADGARNELSRLDEERRKFLAGVDEVGEKILKRGEELKQLIDKQVNELMAEVQVLKAEKFKEIESHHKENIEMKLVAFETFSAYCSELKSKGKPCDITRAANDLHIRATELLQNDVTLTQYRAPVVTLKPVNIHELPVDGQNLVGVIESDHTTDCTHAKSTERPKELRRSESQLKYKLEISEKSVKVLEERCERLRKSEGVMKIKLENSERATAKLVEQLEMLRKTENSLKEKVTKETAAVKELMEQVKQVTDSEQLLKDRLQLVPRVVHTLPEVQSVLGVTSLDDELYVLRDKVTEDVEVYNTTTTTTTLYSLLRHLSIPGLKGLADMTSCKHYRCLYIADYISKCVNVVELNGKVAKWSVKYEPCYLSVTSQFTVIVTCRIDSKLLELTTEGKQLREINLQSDIVNPWHAIQLSNGQFVVCHGDVTDPVHRVCIVDTNGHVTQSYGGPRGSATVEQLNVPVHLAVDKDEFIFVADCINRRVLLLSPTLKFVREIVSRDQLQWEPRRLILNFDRRRLYVAENEWKDGKYTTGRVVVVQL